MLGSHKKIFLFLFSLAVLGYGTFQARNYLLGPRIELVSPKEGEIFSKSIVMISGKARDVSVLSLNGRNIFTNEIGEFKEEMVLAPGVSIIELEGEDKFGKRALIRRTVLVEQ